MNPLRINPKYLYLTIFGVTCLEVMLCVVMIPFLPVASMNLMPLFALLLIIAIGFSKNVIRRENVSVGFLATHLVALIVFVAIYYLAYNAYWADDHPVRLLAERIFHIDRAHFNIWLKLVWVYAFAIVCYFTLMASFFLSRALIPACVTSIVPLILLAFNIAFRNPLWHGLCNAVSSTVHAMLRITGFSSMLEYSSSSTPVVGTDQFHVKIFMGCSGMEGIMAFEVCYVALVIFSWARINRIRAIAGFFIGIAAMYMMNAIRIYVLILIGHYGGSERAVQLWHSQGSTVFYAISLIGLLILLEKWVFLPNSKHEL